MSETNYYTIYDNDIITVLLPETAYNQKAFNIEIINRDRVILDIGRKSHLLSKGKYIIIDDDVTIFKKPDYLKIKVRKLKRLLNK